MEASEQRRVPKTHEEVEFFEVTEELRQMFLRKHNDYGPKNIAATGEVGIVVRMADKVMRLVNLRIDNPGRERLNESVDDAFMDIAVYGVMALLCRRGHWPGVDGVNEKPQEVTKP